LSYLYAWELQPGIHSCSIHPLKSSIPPDGIKGGTEKGCPREYTHIHMGVHEDIERQGKKERAVTRLTSVVSPMQWDAVYLNEKRKIGYEKFHRNKQVRKS
jgi:hypothetical protein